ncbi:MAG: A/G-specific adenine glycosylase, partial [Bacteroidia bacterium]|nr:A/G-specific adenine glycosylase [Bacteroidia bacterium]
MKASFFAGEIIKWYLRNQRNLPWRHTRDPYAIWISEIILQQTRVKQGLPYYQKFMSRYPTVHDLARADQEEVLRLWQGLGYYARFISSTLEGVFPNNYQDLLKLKGIGKYTAAAIASFAFREPVAVVDGNVYRVLARFFGIDDNHKSPSRGKTFCRN